MSSFDAHGAMLFARKGHGRGGEVRVRPVTLAGPNPNKESAGG